MIQRFVRVVALIVELAHVAALGLTFSVPCDDSLFFDACAARRILLFIIIGALGIMHGSAALLGAITGFRRCSC